MRIGAVHNLRFQYEPRRLQMREWPLEFLDFLRGTVHFQPNQVRHLERFSEDDADIIQMSQEPLGIGITFAAKDLVAIDAEFVKEILLFRGCLFDEERERSLKRLELPRVHFEVRMKRDKTARQRAHI